MGKQTALLQNPLSAIPFRLLVLQDSPRSLLAHHYGKTAPLNQESSFLFSFKGKTCQKGSQWGELSTLKLSRDFIFKSLWLLLNKLQHSVRLSDLGRVGKRKRARLMGSISAPRMMECISPQPIPIPKSPLCWGALQLTQEMQSLPGTVLMIYTPCTTAFVHLQGLVMFIKEFLGAGPQIAMLFCSMQCRLLHKSREFNVLQPSWAPEILYAFTCVRTCVYVFNQIHLGTLKNERKRGCGLS